MLYHRTLNPIIHRDWSDRMELFVGALTRTAETDSYLHTTPTADSESAPDTDGRFVVVWSRPHPQPSAFLDTAVEPVPWPTRGRRPPPISRPLLPHERAARGSRFPPSVTATPGCLRR